MLIVLAVMWIVMIGYRLLVVGGYFEPAPRGDGADVASYQFDLSTTRVPRDQIIAAGFGRDVIKALVDPPAVAADVAMKLQAGHGPLLKPSVRVIGVERNGEARAYPLRIVQLHEVCNDLLGGVPIAVTYNPLCDSAVVFGRRVDGQVLEFGVSGLIYNCNTLMFDRHEQQADESLWSQLQFRAVAGPAAEARRTLEIIPMRLVTLAQWLKRHPQTTICLGRYDEDRRWRQRYAGNPYSLYYDQREIPFPLDPAPPDGRQETSAGGAFEPFTKIVARRDAGRWQVERHAVGDPMPEPAEAHALWFAWYAMHPPEE